MLDRDEQVSPGIQNAVSEPGDSQPCVPSHAKTQDFEVLRLWIGGVAIFRTFSSLAPTSKWIEIINGCHSGSVAQHGAYLPKQHSSSCIPIKADWIRTTPDVYSVGTALR
jgi:hypothetical protein